MDDRHRNGGLLMASKRIFISYRRSDTAGHAGRLYDYLKSYFGEERVFFDVDTIKPGTNFEQKISTELDESGVVLVLIGRWWLQVKDAAGNRRLDDPHDYVRMEIETALGKNLMVIPVLLQGADVPPAKSLPEPLYELSRRNAIRISDDQWNSDFKLLTVILRNSLGIGRSLREQKIRRYRQIVIFLSLLGAILAIINQVVYFDTSTLVGLTLRLLLVIALGINVPFVAFLLGSMKQDIDRSGWFTIAFAVLGSMFTAWGGSLTIWASIMMLIVAGLLNFIEADT
jgi:hypothetical protein